LQEIFNIFIFLGFLFAFGWKPWKMVVMVWNLKNNWSLVPILHELYFTMLLASFFIEQQ